MTHNLKEILKEYKGKKVVVTGHTGFKGSWLCIWLKELGADIVGISLDPKTSNDNYVLSGIKNIVKDLRADIRDGEILKKIFVEESPDIVFHLAAQPIVSESYKNPKYTFEVNLLGSLNVLEAVRHAKVKTVVMITSDKCYENKEWVYGYREGDELGGFDPYSSSKACAEIMISSFRRSFLNDIGFASARAGNVIGGGDWSLNRIIPDCIKALEKNEQIILRSPRSTRPWQHVLEPISGYLVLGAKLMKDKKYSEAWNFGPKQENILPVAELVKKIVEEWGDGKITVEDNKDFHEAGLLSLEISKARYKLGWTPRWNTHKAIEKTVEWYKNYKNNSIYDLCKKQIEEYSEDE